MFKIVTLALGLTLLVPGPASADIKAFCDVQREKLAPYFETLADAQRYKIHEQRHSKKLKRCAKIKNDKELRLYCLGQSKKLADALHALPDPDFNAAFKAEDKLRHWKNSLLYGAYCKKF